MQLTGTTACKMRDELLKARSQKKITLKEITDRLCKQHIPEWLQGQIIQMTNHNRNKRITCPIEQAMEAAVSYKILLQVIKESKHEK